MTRRLQVGTSIASAAWTSRLRAGTLLPRASSGLFRAIMEKGLPGNELCTKMFVGFCWVFIGLYRILLRFDDDFTKTLLRILLRSY